MLNNFFLQGNIIGLIVAETKELRHLAKEDRTILATCFTKATKVGYILSLGKSYSFLKSKAFFTHITLVFVLVILCFHKSKKG